MHQPHKRKTTGNVSFVQFYFTGDQTRSDAGKDQNTNKQELETRISPGAKKDSFKLIQFRVGGKF